MEMINNFERDSAAAAKKKTVKFDDAEVNNEGRQKTKDELERQSEDLVNKRNATRARMSRNIGKEEGDKCADHGHPLSFWQEKEQVYACI